MICVTDFWKKRDYNALHLTNVFKDALIEQIFSRTVKAKSSHGLTFADSVEKVFNFSLDKYEESQET